MVDSVVSIENVVAWGIFLSIVAFEIFALSDATTRPTQAYVSSGKLTKPAWILILLLALLTGVAFRSPTGSYGIFVLLGLVATSVYMADVRPVVAVRRGRRP
ncbi:MAG: DUF2516 family protein [Marmoricola sp.]